MFRLDAWAGLTKPVANFSAATIQDCAIKCNILKAECGLIRYDDNTKDCSTAKVASYMVTLGTLSLLLYIFPQIDCIWDVYEVKQKRVESYEGPNTVRVYISEELQDCPCPWRASCPRVRVSGAGRRDIYG